MLYMHTRTFHTSFGHPSTPSSNSSWVPSDTVFFFFLNNPLNPNSIDPSEVTTGHVKQPGPHP